MLSLISSDTFKLRKGKMPWIILSILLLQIVATMLLTSALAPTKISYAFPASLAPIGSAFQFLGALLLGIIGASIIGSEYSSDTWKNLLVRHPGRQVFIVSKYLTLLLFLFVGTLILVLFTVVLGLILQPAFNLPTSSPPVGTAILILLTQFIGVLVAGSIGLLGAVIGRSTVAGIITVLAWLIIDGLLTALPLPDFIKIISFGGTNGSLQASIVGQPATYPVFLALLVVIIYVVAPIVIAAYFFRQRDMLGVAG